MAHARRKRLVLTRGSALAAEHLIDIDTDALHVGAALRWASDLFTVLRLPLESSVCLFPFVLLPSTALTGEFCHFGFLLINSGTALAAAL